MCVREGETACLTYDSYFLVLSTDAKMIVGLLLLAHCTMGLPSLGMVATTVGNYSHCRGHLHVKISLEVEDAETAVNRLLSDTRAVTKAFLNSHNTVRLNGEIQLIRNKLTETCNLLSLPCQRGFDKHLGMNLRSRRSWFDLGGQALATVFGVATTKQLNLVSRTNNDSTMQLQEADDEIRSSVSMLGEDLLSTLDHLNELKKKTAQLGSMFDHERQKSLYIRSMHLLQFASQELLNKAKLFAYKLTNLSKGVVPEGLLTNEMVESLMNEGKRKFPLLEFPFAKDSTNYKLFSQFSVYPGKENYQFILSIPFCEAPIPLLRVEAFPFKIENHLASIKNLPSHMIETEGRAREVALEECSQSMFSSTYLCPTPPAKNQNACIEGLQHNNSEHCALENVNPPNDGIIAVTIGDIWWVLFSKPTIVSKICPTKQPVVEEVVGIFKITRPCTLLSKTFHMPAAENKTSSLEIGKVEFTPFYALNFTKSQKMERENKSLTSVHTLANNIKENLKELHKVREHAVVTHIVHSTAYGSVFVIFIIIAIAAVMLYKRKKSRTKGRVSFEMIPQKPTIIEIPSTQVFDPERRLYPALSNISLPANFKANRENP